MNKNGLARIYSSNYLKSGTRIRRRRVLSLTGFTVIEAIIGITLLAIIVGGILGAFVLIKEYFEDGSALAKSQATARIVAEKIIRTVRAGRSFIVSEDGNTLTLLNYDGSTDVFQFEADNTISRNGNTFGTDIYQISNSVGSLDIFEEVEANKLIKINFEVRNSGVLKANRTVRISTDARLRNEANLSR